MLRTVLRAAKCAGEMKSGCACSAEIKLKNRMIEMVVRRRSDEDNDESKALRKALGRRIAKLRMLRGVSQRQFADLADVSHASYGLLEAGHANVTLMLLDRVAKAMGVPLISLFEDTPAQTTTGMEGLLVRLLGELVRLRRESEVRRDDFARLADETQAFLDANQETLNNLALDGQLSETERKARD
jgi:transcriptional regulator with XRE-family HTH domain